MTSETKQCPKCGEEKPATSDFYSKNSQNADGLYSYCKVCVAKKDKIRYEANKEAIREQNRAYRKANKEAVSEYRKAYYEKNKDYFEAYNEAYYEANKEVILEQKKEYILTPKGRFNGIKKGAKRRNINFSLPFKLYESQLWGKPCHYCGCDLEATGLDRKDSNKGYAPDNVVPCCWDCNTKKNTKPYEQFVAEIKNQQE